MPGVPREMKVTYERDAPMLWPPAVVVHRSS